ncbi:hypothetical protein [Campylobacter magnus]|uniref:Uncharacterized protein n=1 Tax=Campylobacter magnus TaxID=3026462 RepID=A0ABT8T4V5_9BACT|nr:hypothetical protein [Campylobacter magnus]MDO2408599.1 hypothetical protein [Campylobacter magnus]
MAGLKKARAILNSRIWLAWILPLLRLLRLLMNYIFYLQSAAATLKVSAAPFILGFL